VIAFLQEAKDRAVEAASGGFFLTNASIGGWQVTTS